MYKLCVCVQNLSCIFMSQLIQSHEYILLGRQYKARFLCMESCYTSYQAMSPHHNLARYCIKASCPEQREERIHQVRSCSHSIFSMIFSICVGGLLHHLLPARVQQGVHHGLAALGHGPGRALPEQSGGEQGHSEP